MIGVPAQEGGLTILSEGVITVTADGRLEISGFTVTGGSAHDLKWLAIDRARKAIDNARAEIGPRVPLEIR